MRLVQNIVVGVVLFTLVLCRCLSGPATANSKDVAGLITVLKNKGAQFQALQEARMSLGEIGAPAVLPLVDLLRKSEDPAIRSRAVGALLAIGPAASAGVPALIEALKEDGDKMVRMQAAYALGVIGNVAEDVVPNLVEAMGGDADADVRRCAAAGLMQMGPTAHAAVLALMSALKNDDFKGRRGDDWREWPARALGVIAPGADTVIAALTEALIDPLWTTRRGAAYGLAAMGPAAKPVVPAVVDALQDENGYVRQWAHVALWRIGVNKDEHFAALVDGLKDPDTATREGGGLGSGFPGPEGEACSAGSEDHTGYSTCPRHLGCHSAHRGEGEDGRVRHTSGTDCEARP